MNILALVAHPDDAEILCAGTLARYATDGHRVTLAIYTDGSMGDRDVPPAALAETRPALKPRPPPTCWGPACSGVASWMNTCSPTPTSAAE
jgi:hypothetical protein